MIDKLEKEKVEIQDRLQLGLQDHTVLNELALRHKAIESDLRELLEQWTELGSELQ